MNLTLTKAKGAEVFSGFDYLVSFPRYENCADPEGVNESYFLPFTKINQDTFLVDMTGKKMHDGLARALRSVKYIREYIAQYIVELKGLAFSISNSNERWPSIFFPNTHNEFRGYTARISEHIPSYDLFADGLAAHALYNHAGMTLGETAAAAVETDTADLRGKIRAALRIIGSHGNSEIYPKIKSPHYGTGTSSLKTAMVAQSILHTVNKFSITLPSVLNRGIRYRGGDEAAPSSFLTQLMMLEPTTCSQWSFSVAPLLMPVLAIKFNAITVIVSATVTLRQGYSIALNINSKKMEQVLIDTRDNRYQNNFMRGETDPTVAEIAAAHAIVDEAGRELDNREIPDALDISVGVGIGVFERTRTATDWQHARVNDLVYPMDIFNRTYQTQEASA